MRKKFIIIVICSVVVLLMNLAIPVHAQIYYDTNTKITLTLEFSSSGASCYSKIRGGNGVTEISDGVLTLTDKNGNVVQKWDNLTSSSSMLIVSKTAKNVTKGETYTLTITVTVKTSTSSETITESITRTY